LDANDAQAALAAFEEELRLRRDKLAADPRNALARAGLSYCLTFIAKVRLARKEPALAVTAAAEARDLLGELHAADPKDASIAESLRVALRVSGDALRAAGRGGEAWSEYSRSIELLEELLAQDPQNANRRAMLVELLLDAADTNLLHVHGLDDVHRLASRALELSGSTPEMPAREKLRSRAEQLRERATTAHRAAGGSREE
jgi:tetratricopeptide (TPR) repeat protein